MKKAILALVLAAVMTVGLGGIALAEGPSENDFGRDIPLGQAEPPVDIYVPPEAFEARGMSTPAINANPDNKGAIFHEVVVGGGVVG